MKTRRPRRSVAVNDISQSVRFRLFALDLEQQVQQINERIHKIVHVLISTAKSSISILS